MKRTAWIACALSGTLAAACGSRNDSNTIDRSYGATETPAAAALPADDEAAESDETIALDQVPASVRDAALAAMPGLVLVSAERETENGQVVYSLTGTLKGKSYEVEVSASGEVLETEAEDDDADDADDEDEDGDD